MAHRIFTQSGNKTLRQLVPNTQKLKYLLVLDFEATCEKNKKICPQEIIEFPCLVVSTKDWQIQSVFHEFIKPRINSELTPFCTALTGIIQDMIEDQPHFPFVFSKFCSWLTDNSYWNNKNESAFVTCGNWDLKMMLPEQCALDNLDIPDQFKQWIDLKQIFCQCTGYFPKTLSEMLVRLNIPLQGRLHSGIDDTHNMVAVIQSLNGMYNPHFQVTCSTKSIDKFIESSKNNQSQFKNIL